MASESVPATGHMLKVSLGGVHSAVVDDVGVAYTFGDNSRGPVAVEDGETHKNYDDKNHYHLISHCLEIRVFQAPTWFQTLFFLVYPTVLPSHNEPESGLTVSRKKLNYP